MLWHDEHNKHQPTFIVHLISEFERAARYAAIDKGDRRLIMAFREIATMADRIHLPGAIVALAQCLLKKINNIDGLKARSIDARASACLYIACRQENCPRTFKEVCAISSVSKKEIGRCFKLIIRCLPLVLRMTSSADFITRFCGKLGEFIE